MFSVHTTDALVHLFFLPLDFSDAVSQSARLSVHAFDVLFDLLDSSHSQGIGSSDDSGSAPVMASERMGTREGQSSPKRRSTGRRGLVKTLHSVRGTRESSFETSIGMEHLLP